MKIYITVNNILQLKEHINKNTANKPLLLLQGTVLRVALIKSDRIALSETSHCNQNNQDNDYWMFRIFVKN